MLIIFSKIVIDYVNFVSFFSPLKFLKFLKNVESIELKNFEYSDTKNRKETIIDFEKFKLISLQREFLLIINLIKRESLDKWFE